MTDEEMTRLFIIDKYNLRKDLEIWVIKNDCELSREYYAYLAGLKAGKNMNVPIKWHKVADGDLPKDLCLVIACFWELGKKQVREVYFDSKYFCYHGKHIEPVAWQYFPVPPKEELC